MKTVSIANRIIGEGHGVYVIAEAGSNHDGRLEQAMRLVDVASESGADAVKFQIFQAHKLYPRSAGITDYLADKKPVYDIIRALEMPLEWIPKLKEHCIARKIDFLSTPFDEEAADALEPYVGAFKIASYEMTHHPLVEHIARKGKPVIVSTGTATLDEVREMVAAFRATGNDQLVLLQCTAKYPAPLFALNLRTLSAMASEFGVPVGLSDHSREPLPGPMGAVALGASIIEKHFTLSNRLPGPDHEYALEPSELAAMIRGVRQVEAALGTGVKEPLPEEMELRVFARRSIFATRPIEEGETITRDNAAVLRCGKLGYGLHPREYSAVLGRQTKYSIGVDSLIRFEDLA